MRGESSAKWREYPDRGKLYLLCFTGVGGRMGIVVFFFFFAGESGQWMCAPSSARLHKSPITSFTEKINRRD